MENLGRSTDPKNQRPQKEDTSAWIIHNISRIYLQFIETPSSKGHGWTPEDHLRSPSHVQCTPSCRTPRDWDSEQKTELKPSEWISFLRRKLRVRCSRSLGGWTQNDLQNATLVNFHHIRTGGFSSCRGEVSGTIGIHQKIWPICYDPKKQHLMYDMSDSTISNVRNQLAPCLPCQPIKTCLIVEPFWTDHSLRGKHFEPMLLRLLKSENLQKIKKNISFDISWTLEAAKNPKEIPILSTFPTFFTEKGPSLGISGCQGWLLQWRGGSRLVAWQRTMYPPGN